jgi:hypothetical protein
MSAKTIQVVGMDEKAHELFDCDVFNNQKEAIAYAKQRLTDPEYIQAGLYKIEMLVDDEIIKDWFVK